MHTAHSAFPPAASSLLESYTDTGSWSGSLRRLDPLGDVADELSADDDASSSFPPPGDEGPRFPEKNLVHRHLIAHRRPAAAAPVATIHNPRKQPRGHDDRPLAAGRVAALEASLRGFAARQTDVVVHPTLGTVFDSLPEAYEFYNLYSWESGFSIRYGKSRQNVRGSKCMQEIVCGCAGKPIKDNSSSNRTNCPAMMRLLRIDDHGWFVSEHRVTHNHPMLKTCAEKIHCQSHKHIDKYTRDLVKQLRDNNVNLSKVYSIIGSLFGRAENVPFTKRCLRNFCGKLSREQADDDVRKTMDVFS
ncbi:hypothetical protein ACQ4PT_006503 [Festuca glaucescens]